jgi:hypothetical protein
MQKGMMIEKRWMDSTIPVRYVGNHTGKFQLPVMILTLPVLVLVLVLSAARIGTVHPSFFDRHPFLRSYLFTLHTLIIPSFDFW